MNSYHIIHRIRTLASLSCNPGERPVLVHQGYSFTNECWSFEGGHEGDYWLVEKDIEAEDYRSAYNLFIGGLLPVIDRLSFIVQTAFYPFQESCLIYRTNDNVKNIAVVRVSEPYKGVGLSFLDQQRIDLEKLKDSKYDTILFYLGESSRTTMPIARLSFLVSALEALAGIKKTTPKCEGCKHSLVCKYCGRQKSDYDATDTLRLKEICGPELYKKLFLHGGFRQRVFHGLPLEDIQIDANTLFQRIVSYFNTTLGTNISTNVVNPQRNFYREWKGGTAAWKINHLNLITDLKLLVKNLFEYKPQVLHGKLPGDVIPPGDIEPCRLPSSY